jgi:uncharacterized protein with PIN domain
MINSWCISETKPPARHARTSVPVDEKGSCDFDTTRCERCHGKLVSELRVVLG